MSATSNTILIVDDGEPTRRVLGGYVAALGHKSFSAENGCAALAIMEKELPDLVLLDIIMPEMNGYEVLKRMKSSEKLRHLPVIMLSALDELDTVLRCIEKGADDYLIKPFNPTLLKLRIEACLEKKRLVQQEQRSRDLLTSLLASCPKYAIVAADLDHRITLCNSKAEELFGCCAEEVIGKRLQEVRMRDKIDPNRIRQAMPDVRNKGKYEYEVESMVENGSPRRIHFVVAPHKNAAGECVGLLMFGHDVSARS